VLASVLYLVLSLTSPLLSISQINSAYDNSYALVNVTKCQPASQAYFGSEGLKSVCTETLRPANPANSGALYSLVLFSYSFSSEAYAIQYMNSTTVALNTTAWPAGYTFFGNTSSYNGISIYYSTITYMSPSPLKKVITIYAVDKSMIFGVSALISPNATLAQGQNTTSSILYYELRSMGALHE